MILPLLTAAKSLWDKEFTVSNPSFAIIYIPYFICKAEKFLSYLYHSAAV
jgi:hypothetical protein